MRFGGEKMFKLHYIKQSITSWLNELAEFMDPDTGNLFEPINELTINDIENIEKTNQKHMKKKVSYE